MCIERIRNFLLIPLIFSLFVSFANGQEVVSTTVDLEISRQPLADAIKIVANEFDLQVAFYSEITDGIESPQLEGSYTADQALGALLKKTALEYKYVDARSVAITTVSTIKEQVPGKSQPASKQILVAQAGTSAEQTLTKTVTSSTNRSTGKIEAGRNTIEEIIVTARKREERLQDTPISITAFSAQDIEARSIHELSDIGAFTPNMEITPGAVNGGNSAQVFIRGVGQLDWMVTGDPGVGIYVDGVYLARTVGGILDLVDIERIEILRGPQGTLYGKNTIGGAINLVTSLPDGELDGYAEVTTGRYDRMDFKGSIEFPIVSDQLSAKLSVVSNNRDGYGKRLADGGELGDEESLSGRGILRWLPTENLEVILSIDGTKSRESMTSRDLVAVVPTPTMGLYTLLTGPYDEQFLTESPYDTFGTGSNFNELDVWGASITATWDFDNGSFKSISSYRELESASGLDPDGSPKDVIDEVDLVDQNQFTQEIQWISTAFDERLDWLIGAFYSQEDAKAILDVKILSELYPALEALPGAVIPLGPPGSGAPILGGAGNPFNAILDLDVFNFNDVEVESYAVFGHGTFQLTEQFSITAGARYTHEKKKYNLFAIHRRSNTFAVPESEVSESWDAFSPKVGLEYQWTSDLMTYVSATRGFKSGGFNGRPAASNGIQPFDPETLWSYEIGVKSQWFDDRLQMNAAAFFNNYKDIQLKIDTLDGNGNFATFIENAAKAEVMGFELEFIARLAPGLDIMGGLGLLDAEYTKVKPGAEVTKDHEFTETPKRSFNIAAQYEFPMFGIGSMSFRTDYSNKSKVYHNTINTEEVAQNAVGLLNMRLTFEETEGKWVVALFGTNLTDKKYIMAGTGVMESLGFAEAIYSRPREWGLSFKYHF
jgi:iron complex outermembrane recepter protein